MVVVAAAEDEAEDEAEEADQEEEETAAQEEEADDDEVVVVVLVELHPDRNLVCREETCCRAQQQSKRQNPRILQGDSRAPATPAL